MLLNVIEQQLAMPHCSISSPKIHRNDSGKYGLQKMNLIYIAKSVDGQVNYVFGALVVRCIKADFARKY